MREDQYEDPATIAMTEHQRAAAEETADWEGVSEEQYKAMTDSELREYLDGLGYRWDSTINDWIMIP